MFNKILFTIFICVVLLLSLNSCSTNGRSLKELMDSGTEQSYIVQGGDTLMVDVWGEQKLSGEVYVREDGSFTMSLIDDVEAVGYTPKQIANTVATKLKKFIPAANVSVSLAQSAPIRYYLSGQFNKPGEFHSDKKISLLQATATGGSFAPFANESEIILIRKGELGEDLRYVLDYNDVMLGKQPNPNLKNGDFISVK